MSIQDGSKIQINFSTPLYIRRGQFINNYDYKPTEISTISTITSKGSIDSLHKIENIIDNDLSTYWESTRNNEEIMFTLSAENKLNRILFYFGNSTTATQFTLYGSTNNTSFTQIGSVKNIINAETWLSYEFKENATTYKYYKIVFTPTSPSRVKIFGMKIYTFTTLSTELNCNITFKRYDYVPNGTLKDTTITISSIAPVSTINTKVDISTGTQTNMEYITSSECLRLAEHTITSNKEDNK